MDQRRTLANVTFTMQPRSLCPWCDTRGRRVDNRIDFGNGFVRVWSEALRSIGACFCESSLSSTGWEQWRPIRRGRSGAWHLLPLATAAAADAER